MIHQFQLSSKVLTRSAIINNVTLDIFGKQMLYNIYYKFIIVFWALPNDKNSLRIQMKQKNKFSISKK